MPGFLLIWGYIVQLLTLWGVKNLYFGGKFHKNACISLKIGSRVCMQYMLWAYRKSCVLNTVGSNLALTLTLALNHNTSL